MLEIIIRLCAGVINTKHNMDIIIRLCAGVINTKHNMDIIIRLCAGVINTKHNMDSNSSPSLTISQHLNNQNNNLCSFPSKNYVSNDIHDDHSLRDSVQDKRKYIMILHR